MNNDCLFCKIIKGEIPSYTVYEDESVKVFLDVNPNTNGHLLVVPKTHYENLFDTPNEVLISLIDLIKTKLYPLLKKKLNIDGLTISQNNFYGQDIKHLHIHLIPRYHNDEFKFMFNKELLEELENTYNKLNSN